MLEGLTQVCDSTGEEFSTLNPHVVVTVKVQRKVIIDPSTDDEEAENDVEPYLGNRSGEAFTFVVKDFEAAAQALAGLAGEKADAPLKLNLNRSDDSHLYVDAAAQGDDGDVSDKKGKSSTSLKAGGEES